MLNLDEIRAQNEKAMRALGNAELAYDAEYRPLLEAISDMPALCDEVERLQNCRNECKIDCLFEEYNKVVEERDTANKALKKCVELTHPNTGPETRKEFVKYYIKRAREEMEKCSQTRI